MSVLLSELISSFKACRLSDPKWTCPKEKQIYLITTRSPERGPLLLYGTALGRHLAGSRAVWGLQ